MIFTIGHIETYLKAIADSPNGKIQKLGRCEPNGRFPDGYEGGYAFKTVMDAQRRIDEAYQNRGFGIFGLDADWERDTVPSNDGWWHNLINDSDIIVLDGVP